jgi:hypothetical protein
MHVIQWDATAEHLRLFLHQSVGMCVAVSALAVNLHKNRRIGDFAERGEGIVELEMQSGVGPCR